MKRLIWILWPSFLIAIPATGAYFSLFDPVDIDLFGAHIEGERLPAYTIGFFLFWLLRACSSTLSMWLARGETPSDAIEKEA